MSPPQFELKFPLTFSWRTIIELINPLKPN